MQEFPTAREAVRPPHVTEREICELAAVKAIPASRVARMRRYPWELIEAWVRQRVEYAGEAKAPPARPPAVFARACSTRHFASIGGALVGLALAGVILGALFAFDAREPGILPRIVAGRADLDARRPFAKLTDQFGPYEASALWQAAYALDVERARLLLALGVDVESRDTKRGMTPPQAAVERSRYAADKGRPVVALLLASGADPGARAWDGTTLDELNGNGRFADLPGPPRRGSDRFSETGSVQMQGAR